MLVAAVVIIVVVVAVAGAYVLMNNGGGGGGGETVYTMGNATSLQYSLNLTGADGTTGTYIFAGKNLNASDLMLRVDVVGGGTVYSYIMVAGNQTSWSNATGTWAASDFATDWPTWSTQFEGYIAHNENWKTGDGDITYTDSGNSITIYDIVINPMLADSLFTPA
jgi:uncharacterized protein (UPF0333 family)